MEIRIERDDNATFELRTLEQLLVGSTSKPNIARVDDIMSEARELGGGAAWKALVEQELQRLAGRGELDDAIVHERLCIGEGLPEVFFLELGVLAKQIDTSGIRPKRFEHAPNGDPQITDAGLPVESRGVGRDAIELHRAEA